MKKYLIVIPILITAFTSGCSTSIDPSSNDKDIEMSSTTHYIDSTENVTIETYNGFRLTGSELVKNDDGSYKVILDFDKLFEQK